MATTANEIDVLSDVFSEVYFSDGLGHIVALFCFLLYMNNARTKINGNNNHKRWSKCKLGPGTCPLRFGVVVFAELFVELITKFTFVTTSFIFVKVDDKLLDGDDKLLDGDEKFVSGDEKFVSGDEKFMSGDEKFVIFG